MQLAVGQLKCPVCSAARLEFFPVLHHMICAYVGPQYDFAATPVGYVCPKCCRTIRAGGSDGEIVGTSARCVACQAEVPVTECIA
jgi:hypothetical protein